MWDDKRTVSQILKSYSDTFIYLFLISLHTSETSKIENSYN